MTELRKEAVDLAGAIVAAELEADAGDPAVQSAMGKLAGALGKLIGSNGFDVLLARAKKLATRGEPALGGIALTSGGRLEALPDDPSERRRYLTLLLSHLFDLLMKFIGEDLCTRILHDVWPSLAGERSSEGKQR